MSSVQPSGGRGGAGGLGGNCGGGGQPAGGGASGLPLPLLRPWPVGFDLLFSAALANLDEEAAARGREAAGRRAGGAPAVRPRPLAALLRPPVLHCPTAPQVCAEHFKAQSLQMEADGEMVRFCQKCGRFQVLPAATAAAQKRCTAALRVAVLRVVAGGAGVLPLQHVFCLVVAISGRWP